MNHFFLLQDLITPTATVLFMSLTANRPSGGYSIKTSQDMGLVGLSSTMAASPALTNLGSASSSLLVLRSIDLGQQLVEPAGDVRSVAVQHGGVARLDLPRVVQDDHLGVEGRDFFGRVVLGVGGDIAPADVLDGEALDVEAHVVTGDGLGHRLVVHLDRLDLRGLAARGEGDAHARLQDPGLDSANRHGPDSADLVDILQRKTEGLFGGALGRDDVV